MKTQHSSMWRTQSDLEPGSVLESVPALAAVEGVLVVVDALDVTLQIRTRLERARTPVAHEVALACNENRNMKAQHFNSDA